MPVSIDRSWLRSQWHCSSSPSALRRQGAVPHEWHSQWSVLPRCCLGLSLPPFCHHDSGRLSQYQRIWRWCRTCLLPVQACQHCLCTTSAGNLSTCGRQVVESRGSWAHAPRCGFTRGPAVRNLLIREGLESLPMRAPKARPSPFSPNALAARCAMPHIPGSAQQGIAHACRLAAG